MTGSNKTGVRGARVAGDDVLTLAEQRLLRRYDNLDPEFVCEAERLSYSNPDHLHVCTAPDGHRPDDGHVCPCGDWWHD